MYNDKETLDTLLAQCDAKVFADYGLTLREMSRCGVGIRPGARP